MSSKLAFNQEILRSQEAAFIEHYDWLMSWALTLTHDRARAEDLVQEVFAAFAIAHTDLSAVQNMRGYLYRTLRNIHVSEVRLAGRSHNLSRSIVEFSVAEAALAATDPYTIFYTQDQLRRICRYACLRKQSSRAGSVLILRYFHGYLPSEIAQVVGGTCQSVRQNLKFARNEARVFLEDPSALKFIEKTQSATVTSHGTVCPSERLLAELRRAIFDSCEGDCRGREFIRKLYVERLICSADNTVLAHLVSCPICLDLVNDRLGLPLLAERHPADTLGPHNDWRDGTRGPRGLGGNGGHVSSRRRASNKNTGDSFMSQCRRRATELYEHHPAELCVSVNGHVLGSQAVNSRVSRLRLDVTIAEELDFVEVLSEERVRLLVMPVQPPPEGEPVQSRRIALSEGRQLEVTFHHGHPWPMVEVVYEEPNFNSELQPAAPAFVPRLIAAAAPEVVVPKTILSKIKSLRRTVREGVVQLFGGGLNLLRRPFWFQPHFISAIVSFVLIATLLTFRFSVTPAVTATSLLERAGAAESLPVPTGVAVHRVLELEQRRRGSGELVSKNRIEIWRDDAKRIAVRRVYDSSGQLIAGVLANEGAATDGRALPRVSRIYRRGAGQGIESGAPDPSRAIRSAELWQLQPSAREYRALLHHPQLARVSETAESYLISYDAHDAAQAGAGLLQATLTLRKSDLHPTGQTFVINDGRETHDYRLQEVSGARPPLRSVSPAVFELEAEFVSTTPHVKEIGKAERREPSPAAPTAAPVTATAELEVNLAYALDQFRTRFGDQLTLTKTAAGLLEVRGVVDSDETRQEILRALAGVSDDSAAVKVQLDTTAEILTRERARSNSVVVREFAGSDQAIPLYAELRRYFSATVQTDEHLDQLVREFAARVVGRSQRALSHSLELKQLSSRFSAAELEQLTPSTRTKWASLVRNHAEALRRELSTLDGELQRTLAPGESGLPQAEAGEILTDANLLSAIERLHGLVLATDQAVRASFAASSTAASVEFVKGSQFRLKLITSVKIADEVRKAAGNK
ncbi:MAG TPA: sigma-70 family RNA polymerase sigma factor [Pyrinomonadaceae bacterium]|nr:sigma-70 family RNA polymerase sigma factor [Pyrinomonadaceae bacterium]